MNIHPTENSMTLFHWIFQYVKRDKDTKIQNLNKDIKIQNLDKDSIKKKHIEQTRKVTKEGITLESASDNDSACKTRRLVSFHPSIVTVVYERPNTPTGEKRNLFFSREELQQCRNEEKSQSIATATLASVIKSQEKYQKDKYCQQGNVTTVRFQGNVSKVRFQVSMYNNSANSDI